MLAFPNHRPRKRYTADQREFALEQARGLCHLCGLAIEPGQVWEMSHVDVPFEHGGDDVAPAHFRCHKIETAEVTAPTVAKVRRERQKNNGSREKSYSLPCSHRSKFKKKIAGGLERRLTLAERQAARQADNPGLNYLVSPLMRQIAE